MPGFGFGNGFGDSVCAIAGKLMLTAVKAITLANNFPDMSHLRKEASYTISKNLRLTSV